MVVVVVVKGELNYEDRRGAGDGDRRKGRILGIYLFDPLYTEEKSEKVESSSRTPSNPPLEPKIKKNIHDPPEPKTLPKKATTLKHTNSLAQNLKNQRYATYLYQIKKKENHYTVIPTHSM